MIFDKSLLKKFQHWLKKAGLRRAKRLNQALDLSQDAKAIIRQLEKRYNLLYLK